MELVCNWRAKIIRISASWLKKCYWIEVQLKWWRCVRVLNTYVRRGYFQLWVGVTPRKDVVVRSKLTFRTWCALQPTKGISEVKIVSGESGSGTYWRKWKKKIVSYMWDLLMVRPDFQPNSKNFVINTPFVLSKQTLTACHNLPCATSGSTYQSISQRRSSVTNY